VLLLVLRLVTFLEKRYVKYDVMNKPIIQIFKVVIGLIGAISNQRGFKVCI
jgi:hypothetical protein